jgi:hypothetical protein
MPRMRRLAIYGAEPMQRWSRKFYEFEGKIKMGKSALSAIDNIKTGRNCGNVNGVTNNHILPLTFVKHFYHPEKHVYCRLAEGSEAWMRIRIDQVAARQNFYTVAAADGTDSITLERFFKKIEDHVPSWSNGNLNLDNRGEAEYWIAWFIAAQLLRTPLAADIQKQFHKTAPQNMPTGVQIAGNLYAADKNAKDIYSWHWIIYKLDRYQSQEETLLGECCIYSYNQGIIFLPKKNFVLVCSPIIQTQCETMEHQSQDRELVMIRELNRLIIETNAVHGGHIYRSVPPPKS